jgi:hypothetical protein
MSGPGPGSGGPFYAHYVADSTVGFSSDCTTEDEAIFSFRLRHDEGQIPVLEMEIKNPGVGMLSTGRKQWLWFSWWNGSSVVPLFFGRLVGIPSGLRAQVLRVQFIARAVNYIALKQSVAETLKIAPNYDPVFLDESHRDDPDAILEAWSAAFHVDRTSLAWTVSDILIGEDGTVTFTEDQILQDSVDPRIGEPPFTSVRVDMTANWSQTQTGGSIKLGPWSIETYTGSSFLADWPKAGASIGGGWIVQSSVALDLYGIENAQTGNYSYQWKNADKKHNEGDTMSLSMNYSYPVFQGNPPYFSVLTNERIVSFTVAGAPGAPGSSIDQTFIWVPQYSITAYLYLQYKADRKRAERLTFALQSDLQPVLTDPTVQQDSEVIKLNTVALSDPLIVPANWTVLAGQPVALGQVCFPNNPTLPGGTSFQICVVAGTAGATEPVFSDTIGAPTTDGGVTWACLGASLPSIPDWSPSTAASLGTLIAPQTPSWIYYSALLPPVTPFRTAGVDVSEGMVIRTDNNLSFQVCTIGGVTGYISTPAFSPVFGVTTNDGSAQWTSLGTSLPSGAIQMCIQAGTSGLQLPPAFSNVAGNQVTDNTIHWISLGTGGQSISIPAGGQVGNVPARSYFSTDRGRQSLEYGLMKARAHLRKKARCVEIDFAVPFALGVGLSCRKNATIVDPEQLAVFGGAATGKIISYELSCDGDSGEALTKVRIGCAAGTGGTALAVDPTDFYIEEGYIDDGYYEDVGATVLTSSSDLGYAPPLDNPNDDGLTFPLSASQVVLNNGIVGDAATQLAALNAALPDINKEIVLQAKQQSGTGTIADQLRYAQQIAALGNVTVESVLAEPGNSVYLDLQLKPVTGTSFTTVYTVATTKLQIPQQINLAA